MISRAAAPLAALLLLTACTSSGSSGSPTSSGTTSPRATGLDTRPVKTGPTRAVDAPSCPYISQRAVQNTIGMRLGRITVLRADGHVVGCRFYALQNSPLHNSEHLPGPNQPAVEIVTQRFRSATAAHNAFVTAAAHGRNAQQIDLGRSIGVCYQTDFYPRDHGIDWACARNVGSTAVTVRSVDTTGTFSVAAITRSVLRNV